MLASALGVPSQVRQKGAIPILVELWRTWEGTPTTHIRIIQATMNVERNGWRFFWAVKNKTKKYNPNLHTSTLPY